jgi:hypothetical protein
MPSSADLFLACKRFGLFVFRGLRCRFGEFWGLTCDFWAENDKKKCKGHKSVSSSPSGFAPAFGRAVAAARLGAGKRHSKAERQRPMRRLRATTRKAKALRLVGFLSGTHRQMRDGWGTRRGLPGMGNGRCNRGSFGFVAHKVL